MIDAGDDFEDAETVGGVIIGTGTDGTTYVVSNLPTATDDDFLETGALAVPIYIYQDSTSL